MSSNRREAIKNIYSEALALSPNKRQEFLRKACGSDQSLRNEVNELLATDLSPLDFMETPLLSSRLTTQQDDNPVQIGAFQVHRELGRGGLGVVYLAERSDVLLKQQVAIKVLKLGMDSEEIQQRFLRERQILAHLSHPYIAKLIDGGITTDGRLYFAMEYVEGKPLHRFCKESSLGTREKLKLFQKVCSAIRYAHNHLVVHRDIKPNNILVTPEGEPRLLDFGIAKLLDERDIPSASMPSTEPGRNWMTPAYASPEQMKGGKISTASDVYSLGVVLFELLTGKRPFDLDTATQGEAHRVIREQGPAKPSAVVSSLQEHTSPRTSELPTDHSDLRRLRKELAGDLDTIVLKALSNELDRRYVSVEGLSEDIGRYLSGEPIRARPATFSYRTGKFLRRHQLAVGVIFLLFGILASATLGLAVQRDRANKERDRAEAVSAFMVQVFSVADPSTSNGDEVSARELLDRGAAQVRSSFEARLDLKEKLLLTIGRSYKGLGQYEPARKILRESLILRRSLPETSPSNLVQSLNDLGSIEYHLAAYEQGKLLLREALDIASAEKLDAEQAVSHRHLGQIALAEGEYLAAEESFRKALELQKRVLGPIDSSIGKSYFDLAQAMQYQQRFKEALPYAKEALFQARRSTSSASPALLEALDGLAVLQRKLGRPEISEPLFREALAVARTLYPAGHPDVAVVLNDYALLHRTNRNFESAEKLYRESLNILGQFQDRSHPHSAVVIENLAITLRAQRKLTEADPLYLEAMRFKRDRFGESHPKVLESKANYADLLWAMGRRKEAKETLLKVIKERRAIVDDEAPVLATDLYNLAFMNEMEGNLREAESQFREAIQRYSKVFPRNHVRVVRSLNQLASVLAKAKSYVECEDLAREALDLLPETYTDSHWRIFHARSIWRFCKTQQSAEEKDFKELKQSYEFLREDRGEESWQARDARIRLAVSCNLPEAWQPACRELGI